MQPRVIGLDLSLTATGIALPDRLATFSPASLRGVERLTEIRSLVRSCIDDADLVALEGPAYSRQLGAGHHEAAGLWWLIACLLVQYGVPYAVVPPTVLKKYAVGKGNATKADMRVALLKRTGEDVRDDNQADAQWLRLMGLDWLGFSPVLLPTAHRDALAKVAWPEVPRGDD